MVTGPSNAEILTRMIVIMKGTDKFVVKHADNTENKGRSLVQVLHNP